MTIVEAGRQLLVFERTSGSERIRCTFNLSKQRSPFRPGGDTLIGTGDIDASSLGPYAAVVEEIA
jgi:hypothetical protein